MLRLNSNWSVIAGPRLIDTVMGHHRPKSGRLYGSQDEKDMIVEAINIRIMTAEGTCMEARIG